MVTGGVEVRISVLHEQVAGPLVLFGLARPDGVQAVDGRIRIQAAEPADAHLRRLP